MKRILIAQFKHETNSFNPRPTTLEDYKMRSLVFGEDVLTRYRGTESELGAFIELENVPGVELVPVVDGNACPSGLVTRETYAFFRDTILDGYRAAGKIDGILLALHGAQITEDTEDGEGALLEELRAVTGDAIPIIVTLDFHANLTERMVKNSTALFISRYYPHTDFYERGKDAAALMLRVLDGTAHPVCAMRRLPMIYTHMATNEGPMPELIGRLIAESDRPEIDFATFVAGFTRADISIAGSAIYCIAENNAEAAKEVCDRYARYVLGRIQEFRVPFPDPAEAVREAIAYDGLTVLADAADNPGSGLMGDATELIHELIRQNAPSVAVASVWDPETVEQAYAAGVGATIHARIGGKSNPIVGKPVEVDAVVTHLSDGKFRIVGPMQNGVWQNAGRSATLRFGGFTVVVISSRTQTFDLEMFRYNGVEPLDYQILVIKSAVHFKAAYRLVTDRIITLNLPNITSFDELEIDYKHIPHPIFPFDPVS